MSIYNNLYEGKISTHSQHSVEDRAAVKTLESFLTSGGKINTNFSCDDKWPNHDGTFELVSNPDVSKSPKKNFIVQIKGTHIYSEKDGIISYSLKSLAFPAFIANEVTADPGILFIVLNPDVRGSKRVFWKYVSPSFIESIDFEKDSTTIHFSHEDEIEDTDESINAFCKKLQKIIDVHLFLSKLNKDNLCKEDAVKIAVTRCDDISQEIDRIKKENKSRDGISRKIINSLYDVCYAVLVLNAINQGHERVNEGFAWELSQLDVETRYLSDFLKGLKYIGSRIPDAGQSERLMLRYKSYLWEIRKFLNINFNLEVLDNLEDFPVNTDTLDEEYYEMVASSFAEIEFTPRDLSNSRYYIQKKTPFFVKGEKYYEITLQLAGLYATKYNRITVYTKKNISTNYSIQIAYTNSEISLWGVKTKIKVVTNWKVSIDPSCLNKLGKILNVDIKLSKHYGEYISLMDFLTKTGMNLFDFINLHDETFKDNLNRIYIDQNTNKFKDVLLKLKRDYSFSSPKEEKFTVRYLLLNLREEILEDVLPNKFNKCAPNKDIYISKKCYPFEHNPYISNLVGRNTTKGSINDILEITDDVEFFKTVRPYLTVKRLIQETGEIYFDVDMVAGIEEIKKYNACLDRWERDSGFLINEENGLVSINSYESTAVNVLQKLLKLSEKPNRGQKESNLRYLKECNINFEDPLKKIALQKLFVNSQVMMIYGAAGTGKTTLLNYISNMMNQSKKLFLTKTHTALQNLKRRIENPGQNSDFVCIDSYTKKVRLKDYDIVFVDECSTIDNRTMKRMLEKLDENAFLVLAGDIYQIESIDFGNWFYYAKDIVKTDGANVELLNTWRTDRKNLKSLWEEVRGLGATITEKLAMDGPFSADLGEEIFQSQDEDEIVLCLNYDGKFGLNNMNLYFQNANTQGEVYIWEEWTFKAGDPVIFLDTKRSSLLYNNLKGKIVDISKSDDSSITFTLDICTILTERQCKYENFEFVDITDNGTRIRLKVIAADEETSSDSERAMSIIPFQIAYAVSIHKAQGLEYNSVKVIIPSYNAEKISHSIFYTAITRAKQKLKIYWSAETMKNVLDSFTKDKVDHRSLPLIKKKLGLAE